MSALLSRTCLFVIALAACTRACPNQCSGHGICDTTVDKCICNSVVVSGTRRAAWVEADCSQRVCPFAESHDFLSTASQQLLDVSALPGAPSSVAFTGAAAGSAHRLVAFTNNGALLGRDAGVDVRVSSVDTAAGRLTFQYKLHYLPTFSAEVAVAYGGAYSDRARAYQLRPDANGDHVAEDSGVYVYWALRAGDLVAGATQAVYAGDAYFFNVSHNEGKVFVASDGNTPHAVIECAGRGVCDRAAGACACADGYTGDACQRSACPNACSGNGQCTTQKNLVEEGSLGALAYTAADATQQAGCKCDAGFRGADCSLRECPSGADPLGGSGGAQGRDCSGRGNCDFTSGTCACFHGYAGDHCQLSHTSAA